MRNHPIHMDGALCQQLTVSQKPLILADGSSPSVSPEIIFPCEDFLFQVIFPLLVKGQLTGIMYLATPRLSQSPTPSSIELAQQLCGAVALALENAHLYETVQKYVDELE
jgi:GAF domain-containing protein